MQATLRAVNSLQLCDELILNVGGIDIDDRIADPPLIVPGLSQNLQLRLLHVDANIGGYSQGDAEELKRRRNPLTLKLNDKTYQQYPNTMEAILTAHPGIRIQKPFRIDCWPMKQVTVLRDFNWHGRYLVERMDMPLSLWPQVLQIAGMRTF